MTARHDRTPTEDLLVEGLDDWLYAAWMATPIWNDTLPGNRRTMALGLIIELLVDELIVAGDVSDGSFRRWQCSAGEAITRITREWLDDWQYDLPTPGAIAWFEITDKGTDIGRHVLQREVEARG